jgi:hypothetical protein
MNELTDAQDAALVAEANANGASYVDGAFQADFPSLTASQKLKLLYLNAELALLIPHSGIEPHGH